MFAKDKVSQSMIDAVNKVLSEDTVDEEVEELDESNSIPIAHNYTMRTHNGKYRVHSPSGEHVGDVTKEGKMWRYHGSSNPDWPGTESHKDYETDTVENKHEAGDIVAHLHHTGSMKKEEVESLDEVLSKDADAAAWIHDFVHSGNPKFKGKSTKERQRMALGAYYAKQRNEEVEHIEEEDGSSKVNDDWFKKGSFTTYKKPTPVKHEIAKSSGVTSTLEGPVRHEAGHHIITGPKGEKYPVAPEKFKKLYDDNGDGTASPKKIKKSAKLADHDGTLHTSWGDLNYKKGQHYIVKHGPGDYGAVEKDIFHKTYASPTNEEFAYRLLKSIREGKGREGLSTGGTFTDNNTGEGPGQGNPVIPTLVGKLKVKPKGPVPGRVTNDHSADSYVKLKEKEEDVTEAMDTRADVPAFLRKQRGDKPLTPDEVKAKKPDTRSAPGNVKESDEKEPPFAGPYTKSKGKDPRSVVTNLAGKGIQGTAERDAPFAGGRYKKTPTSNPAELVKKLASKAHGRIKETLMGKISNEEVESLEEDAMLDVYLKSRGLNPATITTDKKIAYAKGSDFLRWKQNHS